MIGWLHAWLIWGALLWNELKDIHIIGIANSPFIFPMLFIDKDTSRPKRLRTLGLMLVSCIRPVLFIFLLINRFHSVQLIIAYYHTDRTSLEMRLSIQSKYMIPYLCNNSNWYCKFGNEYHDNVCTAHYLQASVTGLASVNCTEKIQIKSRDRLSCEGINDNYECTRRGGRYPPYNERHGILYHRLFLQRALHEWL